MGDVIRAARGRPGLTENELVDLVEAAALRASVDLGVLTTERRTIELKDPIYEVTLVQMLVQYLLMYSGLDRFEIGWEVPHGQKRIDIVLESSQKAVLVECKDFAPGQVNADAKKLRTLKQYYTNPACYVLCFWRKGLNPEERDLEPRIKRHFANKRGLNKKLVKLVAHKVFDVYGPKSNHRAFGVALFRVL